MAMEKRILVNQRMYPLEAIYAAAYVYVDKCYVFLTKEDAQNIGVQLRSKPETSKKEFERITGDFENELLNHALRLKVAKRTEKLRDAIVHRALYSAMPGSASTGLDLELPAQEGMDYLDDPLGIAVPWEEKFGGETPAEGEGRDGGNKS